MSGVGDSRSRRSAAQIGAGLASMRRWPPRRWAVAAAAAILAGIAIGVPTALVRTGLFSRMTPATWWDYPVWALAALLAGLTAAAYVRAPQAAAPQADGGRRTLGATILAGLAVGCPICNKLVVMLLGVSGALSYWAPLQPALGIASVLLLLVGLGIRLRGAVACPAADRVGVRRA